MAEAQEVGHWWNDPFAWYCLGTVGLFGGFVGLWAWWVTVNV